LGTPVRPIRVLKLGARNSQALTSLALQKGLVAKRVWVRPGVGPTGIYHQGYMKTVKQREEHEEVKDAPRLQEHDRPYPAIVYIDEDDWDAWHKEGHATLERINAALLLANLGVADMAAAAFDAKNLDSVLRAEYGIEKEDAARLKRIKDRERKKYVEARLKKEDEISHLGTGVSERASQLAEEVANDAAEIIKYKDGWGQMPDDERAKHLQRLVRRMLHDNIFKKPHESREPLATIPVGKNEKGEMEFRKVGATPRPELYNAARDLSLSEKRELQKMLEWHVNNHMRARVSADLKAIIPDKAHPFVEEIPQQEPNSVSNQYFGTLEAVAKGELKLPVTYSSGRPSINKAAFGRDNNITADQWDTLMAEIMGARHAVIDADGNRILRSVPIEGEVPEGEWAKSYWQRGVMDHIYANAFQRRGQTTVPKKDAERAISAGLEAAIEALITYDPENEQHVRKGLDPHSAMAIFGHIAREVHDRIEIEALQLAGERLGEWRQANISLRERRGGSWKRWRIWTDIVESAKQAERMAGIFRAKPSWDSIKTAAQGKKYDIDKYLAEQPKGQKALEAAKKGNKEPWEKFLEGMVERSIPVQTGASKPEGMDEDGGSKAEMGLPADMYADAALTTNLLSQGSPIGQTVGARGPMDQERVMRGWRYTYDERGRRSDPVWTGDPNDEIVARIPVDHVVHPSHIATLEMSAKVRQELINALERRRAWGVEKEDHHKLDADDLAMLDLMLFPGLPLEHQNYEVDSTVIDGLVKQLSRNEATLAAHPKSKNELRRSWNKQGKGFDKSDVEDRWQQIQYEREQIDRANKQIRKMMRTDKAKPKLKPPTVAPLWQATIGMQNYPGVPMDSRGNIRRDVLEKLSTEEQPRNVADFRGAIAPVAYHMAMREKLRSPEYNQRKHGGVTTEELKEHGKTMDMGPLGPLHLADAERDALIRQRSAIAARKRVMREIAESRGQGSRFAARSRPKPGQELPADVERRRRFARLASADPTFVPPKVESGPTMRRRYRLPGAHASWNEPEVYNHKMLHSGSSEERQYPWQPLYSIVEKEDFEKWHERASQLRKLVKMNGFLTPGHPNALPSVTEIVNLRKGWVPTGKQFALGEAANPANWYIPPGFEGHTGETPQIPAAGTPEREAWSRSNERKVAFRRLTEGGQDFPMAGVNEEGEIEPSQQRGVYNPRHQTSRRLRREATAKVLELAEAAERGGEIVRAAGKKAKARSQEISGIQTPPGERPPPHETVQHDPLLRTRVATNLLELWDAAMKSPGGQEAIQQRSGDRMEHRTIFVSPPLSYKQGDVVRPQSLATGDRPVERGGTMHPRKDQKKPRETATSTRPVIVETRGRDRTRRVIQVERMLPKVEAPPPSRSAETKPGTVSSEARRAVVTKAVLSPPVQVNLTLPPVGKPRTDDEED